MFIDNTSKVWEKALKEQTDNSRERQTTTGEYTVLLYCSPHSRLRGQHIPRNYVNTFRKKLNAWKRPVPLSVLKPLLSLLWPTFPASLLSNDARESCSRILIENDAREFHSRHHHPMTFLLSNEFPLLFYYRMLSCTISFLFHSVTGGQYKLQRNHRRKRRSNRLSCTLDYCTLWMCTSIVFYDCVLRLCTSIVFYWHLFHFFISSDKVNEEQGRTTQCGSESNSKANIIEDKRARWVTLGQ